MYKHHRNKVFSEREPNNHRIVFLTFVVFLFSAAIFLKLFKLQIIDYDFYSALASDQHQVFKKLVPKRGRIYIQNKSLEKENDDAYKGLYPIAVNKKYNFLYAEPNRVEDLERIVEVLNNIFDLEEEELRAKISMKDDPYEPLVHKVENNVINQIYSMDLAGLGSVEEYARFYPDSGIGGHIIGFVGHADNTEKGQYGIEGFFNEALSGKSGFIKTEKDVRGKALKLWDMTI